MPAKYADDIEAERPIEQVVSDFANFVKEKETKTFLDSWKAKGYKKVGVTELLFIIWNTNRGSSTKSMLARAQEVLQKLKGEGSWFSFLGDLKLTPEKLLKKA